MKCNSPSSFSARSIISCKVNPRNGSPCETKHKCSTVHKTAIIIAALDSMVDSQATEKVRGDEKLKQTRF